MNNALREQARRLSGYIGLFLGQTLIAVVLYAIVSFVSLFAHYVVAGIIVFLLYAVIWWVLWSIQFTETGIVNFYPKLIAATLPLAALTIFYIWSHPIPDYTYMIPILPVEIHFYFATAVTGTVLFPLYSITLARVVFPLGFWRFRSLGAATAVAAVGVALFAASFRLLPPIW